MTSEVEPDWEQRALDAEQALVVERTENDVLRNELKRVYQYHLCGIDLSCPECEGRIKSLIEIRRAENKAVFELGIDRDGQVNFSKK